MLNRLFSGSHVAGSGSQYDLYSNLAMIEPGAEIVSTSDLTLSGNWDLENFKFGPKATAGDLTLRAAGNLIFNFKASLSDGFGGTSQFALWDMQLLPAGSQSWSYPARRWRRSHCRRLTTKCNLSPILGSTSGSLMLGKGSGALPTASTTQPRSAIIPTSTKRSAPERAVTTSPLGGTFNFSIPSPRSIRPAHRRLPWPNSACQS
ncbi:MAG: hypothetical protein WDN28_33240 [Chthoniobacter sp.]